MVLAYFLLNPLTIRSDIYRFIPYLGNDFILTLHMKYPSTHLKILKKCLVIHI